MIEIRRSRTVPTPPEKVWAILSDYPNVWKWAPSVAHSVQVGDLASGVGAGRACQIPGFGEIEERVTEWNEGRSLAYDWKASGPVREGISRWSVHRAKGGSRVEVTIDATMRGGALGELLGKLVIKPKMNKLMDDVLAGLEYHVLTGELVGTKVPKAA